MKKLTLLTLASLLLFGAGCSVKKNTSPSTVGSNSNLTPSVNTSSIKPDIKKICLYHLHNNGSGNLYRCTSLGSDVYVSSVEFDDIYEVVGNNGKPYALCGEASPESKRADDKKCFGHPFKEKATCVLISDSCQPYWGM